MSYVRVVAEETGGPEVLALREEEVPTPGTGEIRVRVLRAGVAFGDIMWMSGKVPGSPKPPYTPGYDIMGVVDAVGPDVTQLEAGQRVVALLQTGGYTEYAIVAADDLVAPVPDDADPTRVASLTLNYVTGWQLSRRVAELTEGQRVLVHGAGGGVGTAMLELGRVMGLEVYGTASAAKHELVSRLGGTPIDYRSEDFVERIAELTGDGVDLVVDHIGGRHLKRSWRTLRRGGTLAATSSYANVKGAAGAFEVLIGLVRLPLWNLLPNGRSATLFDVVTYSRKHPDRFRADVSALLGLLDRGEIDPVVVAEVPLREARRAQEQVLGASAPGKVLLVCGEP